MNLRFVQRREQTGPVTRVLEGVDRVALDAEAAGFHRYSDRLSLVQLTVDGAAAREAPDGTDGTFILDPLNLDPAPLLRPVLESQEVEVVMHGADFDLRLLDRDLDIRVTRLFDTQIAAALLGVEALGLQALLENFLDVRLSKKYQRADWARRPLPREMLEYAAEDTRHLLELAGHLQDELERRGRLAWAQEEFELLQAVRFEDTSDEDPVTRVKAARRMEPRQVARLRVALEWRDRIARARDRAPFRVVGDDALVKVAVSRPRTVGELEKVSGLSSDLARRSGRELLEGFEAVDALPANQIAPYPERSGNGAGRPDPEVEERVRRLKAVRNRVAEEVGVARGILMANASLEALARAEPASVRDLEGVDAVRRWQVELMGDDLLAALPG